ncbi:MAG: sigma 54-interacting transcriptional regulator [Isosphaeraceae bacterium]
MVLDDDPRVLDSFIPGFAGELSRLAARSARLSSALSGVEQSRRSNPSRGPGPFHVRISTHGYESDRHASYRHRSPYHVHLHLVRERGGRFDLARKLLNEQLFGVVISDLRFSEDLGGQRAGQLFIDEVKRVHPEIEGLLYSAYPRPDGFPEDRFIRKGAASRTTQEPTLAEVTVQALERYLREPAVEAFVSAIGELGVVYQSEAFGSTLAQLFDLARLLGSPAGGNRSATRSRRPLPTVLLDGESGTGKRALASLFHAASERRNSPLIVASCNDLTNETLLRSILFGHRRGAFTDAREDRAGLVATAAKGVLLLDDFHRLPTACTAILHSFLEDGEFSRLGEEEIRRHAEAVGVLTVETGPWLERRRSGELPLAFLARVERLPLTIPPLRERPDDIEAQARWLTRVVAAEIGVEVELADDAVEGLRDQPFSESNSRELRNVIERALFRHNRGIDELTWDLLSPFLNPGVSTTTGVAGPSATRTDFPSTTVWSPHPNEWQRRLRRLAEKTLAREPSISAERAQELADALFDRLLPALWPSLESARAVPESESRIPWPVWEDLWRCFSVAWLGGPVPAEKVLGIPANTLRQWISDRESR